MEYRSTYAVGAIIIPDGRLVLSTEGATSFNKDTLAGLSVEIFVSNAIGDPEKSLITETESALGLNLADEPAVSKLFESSATVGTLGASKRDLKFYIYKLNSMYIFETKVGIKSPIMFLSIDQITKRQSNKTLNLSFCAKHMLKHLHNCQALKSFKGHLS